MKNQKTFSTQWKHFREKAGLTQREVSDALGYTTPQFISNVERGRCRFPVEKLPKIKRLYRLSNDQIINLLLSEEKEGMIKYLKKWARAR